MTVQVLPDYIFSVGSIGVMLSFVILLPDGEGSNTLLTTATSTTVTWLSPDGTTRVLSSVSPALGTFQWLTGAREFLTPHSELGRCRVSTASGGVFYTSSFVVQVTAQF